MNRLRAIIAIVSVALLVVVAVAPASAASRAGKATGVVFWYGAGDGDEGLRTSVFRVRDGAPGTATKHGDRGYYYLARQGVGTLRIRVSCVRVDGNEAVFTGLITRATGPKYTVGAVFIVSVKDSGRRGRRGDKIGMQSISVDSSGLQGACDQVLSGDYTGYRAGHIVGGNIRVRGPR